MRTDVRAPRSRRVAAIAAAIAGAVAVIAPAEAKVCGGAVPCSCGDTVGTSTTLAGDLGVCTGIGLRVLKGVVLDCAGHTITGSDRPGAWYGIHLDRTTGAEVRNCRVTKFRRGIRLRAGGGNVVSGNELFGNRYGIDVAGASRNNRLLDNWVHDNRDEGVHVGTDSDGNEIAGNEISYSKRENLYLLSSDGNTITGNVLHHSDHAAIYLKHGWSNRVVGNEVRDRPIQVRGDSVANVFETNELKGDGYIFEAYQDAAGRWTHPHANEVHGGRVRKTDWCFRFLGAYDNHATGVVSDGRCTPMVNQARGGVEATGNTVEVIPRP
jgi:parallel beta-helix repeat protein